MKLSDAVAVLGLGDEAAAFGRGRRDHALRIERAGNRDVDCRARVEPLQAPRQPLDCRGLREIGLGDHQAVGEDHLLARLGGHVERRLANDGIDHREHDVDMKFAAQRAIGGKGLQDRSGIGETAGFDHDARERRHRAALAVEHEPAQRDL